MEYSAAKFIELRNINKSPLEILVKYILKKINFENNYILNLTI